MTKPTKRSLPRNLPVVNDVTLPPVTLKARVADGACRERAQADLARAAGYPAP